TVADAVLFRPLPYHEPDRLVIARMQNPATGERYTFVPMDVVQAIHGSHRGVGEVARLEDGPFVTQETPDGLAVLPAVSVTANYFQVLGVRAHAGRIFTRDDEAAGGRVVMLTHQAWRRRFGGRDVVGRPLALATQTFDVVGILPRDFVFPTPFAEPIELVTVAPEAIGANPNTRQVSLNRGAIYPVARLEPGVTRSQAQSELDALFRAIPPSGSDPAVPVFDDVRAGLQVVGGPIMRYMLVGAVVLLLLGCANLANLLLARGRRRERETGVRAALGATQMRIVRPLLIESLLLALGASLVAMMLARVAFDLLIGLVPPEAYLGAGVGVDARVLWFTLALGLAAGVTFGVAPAWHAARRDAQSLIQRRARSAAPRAAVGTPLVAVQVALAIVLVFGAAIAGRAFVGLLRQPPGFSPDGVLTVNLDATQERGEALQDLLLRLMDDLRGHPEVVSVGATSSLPQIRPNAFAPVFFPGTANVAADLVHALPGFFETARIPVLAGRVIALNDARAGAPLAVLSAHAARVLFPGRDPLGAVVNASGRELTVVGVVGDVRQRLAGESAPLVYAVPGRDIRATTIVVRMREGDAEAAAAIRRRASALVPGVVVRVAWWTDRLNALAAYRNPRFQSIVLGSFATIALVLTTIGVFGVVAFLVASRRRDMGIRLALGSAPGALVAFTMRRSLAPVVIGAAAGLASTRLLARLAETQLYEVDSTDPMVLAATTGVVLLAAAVAAWLPARRAARIDPLAVLRQE
ncbi:MAG TPA: ABC transporter permease, partial [Gemmatimonadaceae bacterium]|nr:ABC transporter permease [Gemmatimonadaceae bacterium]